MRQASTAVASYREIEPTLGQRQTFVRGLIVQFAEQYGYAPTSLELLRFATAQHPDRWLDVNSVRPRLRELWEQGYVRHGDKRACKVSGKRVLTWEWAEPAKPGRLF